MAVDTQADRTVKSESPRIRVARVISRLNVGGPSIHVVNLNGGLSRYNFESRLVTGYENPGEGSMLDYARANGVKPFLMSELVGEANLRPRDIQAIVQLTRFFREWRPQIVHTHTAKAGFVGRIAARMSRVPVVLHTYHGHVLNGYFGPWKSEALRRMEQTLGLLSDRLIAISPEVRDDLVRFGIGKRAKIPVIPLGFDLKPFRECGRYRGEFRRQLGLESDQKLIGIVGRIFPVKNHRLFLEAARVVRSARSDAHFVIVGDGRLRREIEDFAVQLGMRSRVSFTGWRTDLPRVYADLDMLVVSSISEGTPVAAIEAMASGCPVVATEVGGMTSLIEDGRTGILVESRNRSALAKSMLKLLAGPDCGYEMARQAQKEVLSRFTVQRLIDETQDLYWRLLSDKGLFS